MRRRSVTFYPDQFYSVGDMRMIGIYKITNKINGHSYIGQSVNILKRWNKHRSFESSNAQYPLYRAFKKYGIDNFIFQIIEECPVEKLDEREIY